MRLSMPGFLYVFTFISGIAWGMVAVARADDTAPVYKRSDAKAEKRAEDLLGRMTLGEKLRQICGFWPTDESKLRG